MKKCTLTLKLPIYKREKNPNKSIKIFLNTFLYSHPKSARITLFEVIENAHERSKVPTGGCPILCYWYVNIGLHFLRPTHYFYTYGILMAILKLTCDSEHTPNEAARQPAREYT